VPAWQIPIPILKLFSKERKKRKKDVTTNLSNLKVVSPSPSPSPDLYHPPTHQLTNGLTFTPVHRTLDPLFALLIGTTAATIRIRREEAKAGRSGGEAWGLFTRWVSPLPSPSPTHHRVIGIHQADGWV